MQALVKARSKLSPWRRSRRIPGRFCRIQLGGKCWIARSWSVRKRMMFFPATSLPLLFSPASACSTPVPWESSSAPAAVAPDPSSCLRVSPLFSLPDSSMRFLSVGLRGAMWLPGDSAEDRDRVALFRGRVEIGAVRVEHERAKAAQAAAAGALRESAEAAALQGLLRDRAGAPAAVEDSDRAGRVGGGVDAGAVGRDADPLGAVDGTAEGAAGGAHEDQAAGGARLLRQPAALAEQRAHVDVFFVGADRDRVGAVQLDTRGAAGQRRVDDAAAAVGGLGQATGRGVAVEDREALGGRGADIDAAGVGADRHALDAFEGEAGGAAVAGAGGDAADVAGGLGQRAGGRVAVEDRDRVAGEGAARDALCVG